MESKNRKIDDIFREKLADFSPEPPADIWENINQAANKGRVIVAPLYKYAAAVMLLLSGIGIALWLNTNSDSIDSDQMIVQQLDVNETVKIKDENEFKTESDNIPDAENTQGIGLDENTGNSEDIRSDLKRIVKNEDVTMASAATIQANKTDSELFISQQSNGNLVHNKMETVVNSNDELTALKAIHVDEIEIHPSTYTILNSQESNIFLTAENKDEKGFWKNVSLGGQITPTYSYRTTELENAGATERPLNAFSAGIYVSKQVKNKWHIKSGLYYDQIGTYHDNYWEQGIFTNSNANKDIFQSPSSVTEEAVNIKHDNSIGYMQFYENSNDNINSESDEERSINNIANQYSTSETSSDVNKQARSYTSVEDPYIQKLSSIEIPFVVEYFFLEKAKFNLYAVNGVNLNFIARNKLYDARDNHVIGYTSNVSAFNIISNIAFGIQLPVKSKLMLTLEPTFKFYLNDINIDSESQSLVTTRPYSFGVYTGLRYSL